MNSEETMIRHAIEDGEDAIVTVLEALKRAKREIEMEAYSFDTAKTMKERANALNRIISYCASNIIGNMRLEVVADRQSTLSLLAEKQD